VCNLRFKQNTLQTRLYTFLWPYDPR